MAQGQGRRAPTRLKILRGNPGCRRILPEPQPEIPVCCPEPPRGLDELGVEEWRRIAPELHGLKLLSALDVAALGAYCDAVATWLRAGEELAKLRQEPAGGLAVHAGLRVMVNPLVQVRRQAAMDMVKFAGEFGMTPVARARLAGGGVGVSAEPESKFGDLLKAANE